MKLIDVRLLLAREIHFSLRSTIPSSTGYIFRLCLNFNPHLLDHITSLLIMSEYQRKCNINFSMEKFNNYYYYLSYCLHDLDISNIFNGSIANSLGDVICNYIPVSTWCKVREPHTTLCNGMCDHLPNSNKDTRVHNAEVK